MNKSFDQGRKMRPENFIILIRFYFLILFFLFLCFFYKSVHGVMQSPPNPTKTSYFLLEPPNYSPFPPNTADVFNAFCRIFWGLRSLCLDHNQRKRPGSQLEPLPQTAHPTLRSPQA
jgi:hypothetical protein